MYTFGLQSVVFSDENQANVIRDLCQFVLAHPRMIIMRAGWNTIDGKHSIMLFYMHDYRSALS